MEKWKNGKTETVKKREKNGWKGEKKTLETMLFAIQKPTLPIARQLAIYILWFHIGLYIVVSPILIVVNLCTLFVPPWYANRRKRRDAPRHSYYPIAKTGLL